MVNQEYDHSSTDTNTSINAAAASFNPDSYVYPLIDVPTDPIAEDHMEAPFSYKYKDHESVSLSNGSFQFVQNDFVVPGKNGLDLEIGRLFQSSKANREEVDLKAERQRVYYYLICENNNYSGSGAPRNNQNLVEWEGPYSDSSRRTDDAKENRNARDSTTEIYDGVTHRQTYTYHTSHADIVNYKTGTRPNDHFKNTFGLGYGWSFHLPSIENVSEYNKKNELVAFDFLHLGNGAVFKISENATSTTKSNFEDYALTDLRIMRENGTVSFKSGGTSSYNYVLYHKNGRKQYFLDGKLICTEDRFGNQIRYIFATGGGATIIDSLNRTIRLTKGAVSGGNYQMTWELPDGENIVYAIENDLLVSVREQRVPNQTERVTRFAYAPLEVAHQYYKDISGDGRVPIVYNNLTMITHPTGAQTHFNYVAKSQNIQFREHKDAVTKNYGRVKGFNTIESRWDTYPGKGQLNLVKYDFTTTQTQVQQYKKYSHHINSATVTENGLETVHTFNHEAQPLESRARLLTTGSIVRETTYTPHDTYKQYNKKEVAKIYGSSATPMTLEEDFDYDGKGNLIKHINADRVETTCTYDQDYGYLLTKSFPQSDSVTILEEYKPKSSDKRVVEDHYVYANGVAKQRTNYQYDSAFNVIEERRYYGNLSGSNYYATHYVYDGPFVIEQRVEGVRDAQDALIASPYGAGVVKERFTYDVMGRKLSHQGAADADDLTRYTYDALGRLRFQYNPDDTDIEFRYDDINNTVTRIDEEDHSMRTEYTPLGQKSGVFDAANKVQLQGFEYDAMGRLEKEKQYRQGGVRSVLTMQYDHFNRPKSKRLTNATGSVELSYESYDYDDAVDARHAKVTMTQKGDATAPNVVTVIYTDVLGRTVKEAAVENGTEHITEYTYDKAGNKTLMLTPLDRQRGLRHSVKWEQDHAGRAVIETNALNQVVKNNYDALGNLASTTDVKGYSTQFTYDSLGRLIVKKTPFEQWNGAVAYSEARYDYDPAGRLLRERTSIHRAGETQRFSLTEHSYDLRGRQIGTAVQGDGDDSLVSRYEYDGVGNQVLIQCGDNVTAMTYNQFGKLLTRTDALGQVERFVYDAVGMLSRKTDRNGNVTEYAYDDAGRLVAETVTAPDGTVSQSEQGYSLTGQTAWSRNDTMRIDYRYDLFGRNVEITEGSNIVKSYTYDVGGNRTAFALRKNGGVQVSLGYEYDTLNRLTELLDATQSGAVIAQYTYDENGNRKTLAYPRNGVSVSYTYNLANLVTGLTNSRSGAVLSRWTYEYQLDGNQVAKIDKDGVRIEYQYDRLGQLVCESNPERNTVEYAYDRSGNRTRMSVSGQEDYVVGYEYDVCNRLLRSIKQYDETVEATSYAYDGNGNQVKSKWVKTSPMDDGETGYACFADGEEPYDEAMLELREYNSLNQLVQVFRDGQVTRYTYRPDGMRHSKASGLSHKSRRNDAETVHHWDGQEIVMESANSGVVKSRYLRGIGLVACELDGVLQYYLHNAHGDVVHRVDGNGNVLRSYEYDAFGVEVEPEALDFNPFRYCGEYFDRETGTIYLRARNYRPIVGRFTGEDPIRDGLNWYAYCNINPLMFIDPSGLRVVVQSTSVELGVFFYASASFDLVKDHYGNEATFLTVNYGTGVAAGFGQSYKVYDQLDHIEDYLNRGNSMIFSAGVSIFGGDLEVNADGTNSGVGYFFGDIISAGASISVDVLQIKLGENIISPKKEFEFINTLSPPSPRTYSYATPPSGSLPGGARPEQPNLPSTPSTPSRPLPNTGSGGSGFENPLERFIWEQRHGLR